MAVRCHPSKNTQNIFCFENANTSFTFCTINPNNLQSCHQFKPQKATATSLLFVRYDASLFLLSLGVQRCLWSRKGIDVAIENINETRSIMNIDNSTLVGFAHEGARKGVLAHHAAMTDVTHSIRTHTESISSNTNGENSMQESFFSVLADNFALFVVLLLAISIIVIGVATFCYTRFGWRCCLPGSASESSNDQLLAAQLRQELAQQTRETAAKQKQTKRLQVYQQFLKTNSRIVQPQDLIGETNEHSPKCAAGADSDDTESSASTHSNNEDMMIQFTIPVNDEEHGTDIRTEATCSICLKQYQPGESIVWSTSIPGCRHVYHADCMFLWFATGKKRCPVCRKYFVPSKRVGVVTALALRHLDSSMSQ